MLWYKSWLETRWRFLIALALLMCSAAATVLSYPAITTLLLPGITVEAPGSPPRPTVESGGELGRAIAESATMIRDYRGYIWSQFIRQTMRELWALFAVVLGTGGLLAQAAGGGALFTLSLPVSRSRVLIVRAAMVLAELAILAIVPTLLIPLLSPIIGQTYSLADALVYGICMFLAGSTLFSLAFLLSTVFSDPWRPPLIVLCLAAAMGIIRQLFVASSGANLLGVMTAEAYFHGGGLPWPGLLVSVALSAFLIYAATRNIARRDF